MGQPIDRRGYVGAEKNRQLTPEQVVWARDEFYHGRVTPRQLAMMWHMGIESVRRMLRGDTYANIGQALPRAEEAAQMDVGAGESLKRLMDQVEKENGEGFEAPKAPQVDPFAPAQAGEGDSHESAIDAFLNAGKGKQ